MSIWQYCTAPLSFASSHITVNHLQKLFISYILVNDFTIETPVSFAVEQLKTSDVCKKKQ